MLLNLVLALAMLSLAGCVSPFGTTACYPKPEDPTKLLCEVDLAKANQLIRDSIKDKKDEVK